MGRKNWSEKLQILDLDPADEGLSRRVVTPSVCEPGYTSFCTSRRETATGGGQKGAGLFQRAGQTINQAGGRGTSRYLIGIKN